MSGEVWESKWQLCREEGRDAEAFDAAAKAFEAFWGGEREEHEDDYAYVDSDMFHCLGDGYMKQQKYREASKVYYKGAEIFDGMEEEASLRKKYEEAYELVLSEAFPDGFGESRPPANKNDKKKKKKRRQKKTGALKKLDGETNEAENSSNATKIEETVGVASEKNDGREQIVGIRTQTIMHEEKVHFAGWKFSRDLDFSVDTHLEDGLYSGFMKSSTSVIPKLFIEPVRSQFDTINLLQTLVSKGNSFLKVDFLIESSDTHPAFLVVDDVYPLDHFFVTKFENFISERSGFDLGDNKTAWWDLIAKEFTQIFRDIAHGLMTLYSSEGVSLGGVCGNLSKNMYVTKDGRGKILPSLDRTKNVVEDLEDLAEKMRSIIGLPCPVPISEVRDLKEFAISDELIDFLGADYAIKLRYVPALWLVNHPCFWISPERSSCILRLIYLTKRKAIHLQLLCCELDRCETFLEHTRLNTHWSDGIGNTLFRAILNKKKGVANYVRSIDIVRYMGACYGHVNESEYDQLRGANIIYSEDDVEKELRSFFPKIILELFQALYGYAVSINYRTPGGKTSFMEALKDLSSCCFKTDLHRAL